MLVTGSLWHHRGWVKWPVGRTRYWGLLTLLAAVATAQVACLEDSEKTGAESRGVHSPRSPQPTDVDLAQGEWVLFSNIFEAMPVGGYPIRFTSDHTVFSQNLSLVTGWRLSKAAGLELLFDGGEVAYSFQWLPSEGFFKACPEPVVSPGRRAVIRS